MTSAVGPTLYQLAAAQLDGLGAALELAPERLDLMQDVLSDLAEQCRDRPVALEPRWSGLSDDCSPIEWSVAFRRGDPDVRVLVEAQDDPPSPGSYWAAGVALTHRLVRTIAADDTMLRRVVDLFAPTDPAAFFASYHGIEFRHDASTRAKVYLNPAASGAPSDTLAEALERLGLAEAWASLCAEIDGAQLVLLALDLAPESSARVKLYLRSAAVDVLRRLASLPDGADPHDVDRTLDVLCPGGTLRRGAFVVLHYTPGAPSGGTGPSRAVLDLPVSANCGCDAVAVERIASLLTDLGLDAPAYRRVAAALAGIGPTAGVPSGEAFGLHNYVSMQREPDGSPRVTTYFGLRAYALRHGWLALDPHTTWPSPVTGGVRA